MALRGLHGDFFIGDVAECGALSGQTADTAVTYAQVSFAVPKTCGDIEAGSS